MQICPKCSVARKPTDTNPEWQCPACGVAYNKVGAASNNMQSGGSETRRIRANAISERSIPWGKLILIAAVLWGGWTGLQVSKNKRAGLSSVSASIGGDISSAELNALAASVKEGEVIIYTTTHCPYCAQAKAWMAQNKFAFTECDAEVKSECSQQLKALGGMGVPFLVVRGHPMKDGFDSDEFVSLLKS